MPDAALDLQGMAVSMLGGKQPRTHRLGCAAGGKVSGLRGRETLSTSGYWAMAGRLFHLHTLTPEFQSFSPIRERKTLKNYYCHTADP